MLSPISAAVAAAPATLALTDPVLANTSLANSTPANAALAHARLRAATPSRVRPGARGSAVLHGHAIAQLAVAAPPLTAGPSPIAQTRASEGTVALGAGTRAAGQAEFARQQRSDMKFAYPMARIAPTGWGGVGSYPARDPV